MSVLKEFDPDSSNWCVTALQSKETYLKHVTILVSEFVALSTKLAEASLATKSTLKFQIVEGYQICPDPRIVLQMTHTIRAGRKRDHHPFTRHYGSFTPNCQNAVASTRTLRSP